MATTNLHLPLEIIFNLLSQARRSLSERALQRRLQQRQFYYGTLADTPGFRFWLRLAQAAFLLDEYSNPTLFVRDWLEMTIEDKILHLLEAWVSLPVSPRNRKTRASLVHLLQEFEEERPLDAIPATFRRELAGLQALGLVQGIGTAQGVFLTTGGRALLAGELLALPNPAPWHLDGGLLWVPYPPDYALLWELETYLDPADPGVYVLNTKTLRLARQRALALGDRDVIETLPALLARGLALPGGTGGEHPFLANLSHFLDDLPTIEIVPGFLLTFSQPDELARLRRVRKLRPLLVGTLSAHHLFLSELHAAPVLNWLQQRGLWEAPPPGNSKKAPWTLNEQAVLLALLLFAQETQKNIKIPAGLFSKLADRLPLPLRAAAVRQAMRALKAASPQHVWIPELEPPNPPETEVLAWLARAITTQTVVDFWYRKTRLHQAEQRHVTPLLIEQRGMRFYLVGYCHARRANRLFRIDKLEPVKS